MRYTEKCICKFGSQFYHQAFIIIHLIKSPYNFSMQNCSENSDRVQFWFQSPQLCVIKHLKNTKLYSVDFPRTEMTLYPSNHHREHSLAGSCNLFQFEGSDVNCVLKSSMKYSSAIQSSNLYKTTYDTFKTLRKILRPTNKC